MKKKVDIKDLANRLKNGERQVQEVEIKEEIEEKKSIKAAGINTSTEVLLKQILASNKQEFSLTEAVYIDREIHEVFKKLKSSSQLKIGTFISYLLEQFIRENINEISEIINKKQVKNKFLNP
ncbi:hypothetical protein [Chondrinema litorale]|uniref:hypothetical protein n=1 Tax=Chondrinema litorale TaxID=2994555 RepID=UPI002542E770|nr:hypothetical protein [Chondrinema litorale]UZS00004.1 hypothetical protein OQ292_39165 [Chondrinema litorale]